MKTKRDTKFGADLMEALQEVRAHQRGDVALPTRLVDAISAKQVKAIRTANAKSPKEFEARFGIPARTVEGWEQGRKLDVSARILMAMIEREPQVVEATVERLKMGYVATL
jgi:putative transcriptional regulator